MFSQNSPSTSCVSLPHFLWTSAFKCVSSSGNHAEGRSFPRTASRLVNPSTKISKYRFSNPNRPHYSQPFRRYSVHRAQERFQPSEVGKKRKRPSSLYLPQPPNLLSSLMQNTEMRPSQPSGSLESGSQIQVLFPPDSPMLSEQSNSPSDPKEEEAPPKQTSMDQTPPSMELTENSYSLSRPVYPFYHHSEGNPLRHNWQDYLYVDYDPNSPEHKPYTQDHLHYYQPAYYMSYPNSTNQPMEPMETKKHGPEEKRNQKPYTFYYIGRKLWYLPMYFSAYFAAYITAILVKAIARHKIRYPLQYWTGRSLGNGFNKRELELVTGVITKALETTEHRYT